MDVSQKKFVICIDNSDYPVALEVRKVYLCLPDATAERRHMLRVVDESGDDYLYPEKRFAAVELSQPAARAFLDAA